MLVEDFQTDQDGLRDILIPENLFCLFGSEDRTDRRKCHRPPFWSIKEYVGWRASTVVEASSHTD